MGLYSFHITRCLQQDGVFSQGFRQSQVMLTVDCTNGFDGCLVEGVGLCKLRSGLLCLFALGNAVTMCKNIERTIEVIEVTSLKSNSNNRDN